MEPAGAPGGALAMASEAEELDHELEVIRAITGVTSADKSAYEGLVLNRKGIIVRARLPTNDGATRDPERDPTSMCISKSQSSNARLLVALRMLKLAKKLFGSL